jgi:hypothetical protein
MLTFIVYLALGIIILVQCYKIWTYKTTIRNLKRTLRKKKSGRSERSLPLQEQ